MGPVTLFKQTKLSILIIEGQKMFKYCQIMHWICHVAAREDFFIPNLSLEWFEFETPGLEDLNVLRHSRKLKQREKEIYFSLKKSSKFVATFALLKWNFSCIVTSDLWIVDIRMRKIVNRWNLCTTTTLGTLPSTVDRWSFFRRVFIYSEVGNSGRMYIPWL